MTHAMVFTGCHEPEEGGGGVVRCACAVACGSLIISIVQVEGGELLGRGQGREGLLDDDLGLVQGVCVRDRGGQEHRAAGDPGRGRDGAHHPPRLGPARRPRQVTVSRHSLAAGGCLV